jgi:hypothetical protein
LHHTSRFAPKLHPLKRPLGGWEAFEDNLAQAGVSMDKFWQAEMVDDGLHEGQVARLVLLPDRM